MRTPKYSVLITTHNTEPTLKPCLESVLTQIDDDYEVLIVDSHSTDGSLEYLKSLADNGEIRLIVKKCNRGEGRQEALENARGKYVIARVDMDSLHNPVFKQFMQHYIKKEKELGSFVLNAGALISSKDLLLKVGGWRPLQWGENYELYKRLMEIDKLYLCRINEARLHMKFKYNTLERLKIAYVNYRDSLRMGLGFKVVAKELWSKCRFEGFLVRFLLLCICWITQHLHTRYSTFEHITWEEFYRDKIYADELNFFEEKHPDKILSPPEELKKFPEMEIIFLER